MADEEDHVESFCSITGASKYVAKKYLETCRNNLVNAVQSYYDNPSLFMDESQSSSSEDIRAPIAPVREVLVDPPIHRNGPRKRRRLPESIFDQSPFHHVSRSAHGHSGTSSKVASLADLFRPPVDIMFAGTFKEARIEARRQQKWLLINVQDTKEFSCQILNRDVWNNPELKCTIKSHFVFWQVSSITDDGIEFSRLYHVDKYPYVAVVDPRTGEKLTHWNQITVDVFKGAVMSFLTDHSFEEELLPVAKRKKDQKEDVVSLLDESEDSQMVAAIPASLEDQPSSSSLSNALNTVDLTDSKESSPSPDEPDYSLSKEHTLLLPHGHALCDSTQGHTPYCVGHTHYKIHQQSQTTGPEEDQAALIIRLPCGERLEERFPADCPLQDLMVFLTKMGYDCSHGNYEVVANFPNRIISALNLSLTFREVNLYPRATLFIQAV